MPGKRFHVASPQSVGAVQIPVGDDDVSRFPRIVSVARPAPMNAQESAAAQPVRLVLLEVAGRAAAVATAQVATALSLGEPETVDEAINRQREARWENWGKHRASHG